MWVILQSMLFYFPLKGLQSSFYWSQGSFSAWGTFLTYVFHRCPARILSRERGESLPVTYQNYWCMLIMWSRPENWWWEIVSKSILTCWEWILFAGYQPDFQQYYWHLWVLCYIAGFVGGSNWSCRWRQTASNRGMLWRNGRGMKC